MRLTWAGVGDIVGGAWGAITRVVKTGTFRGGHDPIVMVDDFAVPPNTSFPDSSGV
jgi:hypothetical protein